MPTEKVTRERQAQLREFMTALLDGYDRMLESAISIHAEVAMDTDDDRALHAKAIENLRAGQATCREQRGRLGL